MALVSQAIKNLKGGISQQPDILRYDDQGAEQVNAFSSEVEGLQKRPPTVHKSRLGAAGIYGERPLCHLINRDDTERYQAIFTDQGAIHMVDLLKGEEVTVNYPDGNEYIKTPNPRDDLRMVTVADYTFIINKRITIAEGGELTPQYIDPARNAIVSCSGGQYGRTFQIIINGSQAAIYTTPLGDKIEHATQIDIKYILGKLVESAVNFKNEGWEFHNMSGNYIWIKAPANAEVTSLSVEDGYNGKLLAGIMTTVQRTSDLPVEAPSNYQVSVTGEAGSDQDDYWLRYDASRKVWTECPAPNVPANLNDTTMPWTLIRQADGTFTLQTATWAKRNSGDLETNPWPSFVDGQISDVFFFRNRLGFLSGENVVLSEAASYFNFFPPSVAVTADSDPIDVAVSTNRISLLKYAVPFSEELLLWSDHNQFVLGADGVLTPTSVKLDMTTEFEVADNARPYGVGRGVYFVSPRANFSSVRRYYAVQDVTQVKNAEDISAHVPSYVPNGVHSISGSSTENFLSILSEGAPNKIFMYKFLYLQEELAQQSWSHWDMGTDVRVLCCNMVGSTMFLILDTAGGVFLESITFTQHTKDFDTEPFRLHIDRKATFKLTPDKFNWDTYKTSFKLKDIYGDNPKTGRYYVIFANGTALTFDPPTGGWPSVDGLIEIDGDITDLELFIGEAYEMRYKFSKFLIKSTDSAGNTATEDIGRLQLRRAWVNYENSGNFAITVENQGRPFTYNMTGQRLGTKDFILGAETLDTGQFRYPVAGNAQKLNVTLTSSTPNPVAIIGGGWEGNYVRRSSGI
jgi:hypothetical protein